LQIVFVASENPVKILATKTAIEAYFPKSKVLGLAVESAVSAQPMSDKETYQGAHNRLEAVYQRAVNLGYFDPQAADFQPADYLFVAAEGGVYTPDFRPKKELWSTVWVAAMDASKEVFVAGGAHFLLPEILAEGILAGKELGDVLANLTQVADIKKKEGAIGLLTDNFVDRTAEYSSLVKLAVGQWYGRENFKKFIDK
jgi:inosine/xanthosine triphosphatase